MTASRPAILVLAGRRGGADPVAQAARVTLKAFAPVAGIPMLERVAAALRGALPGARLGVAMDADSAAAGAALLDRLGAIIVFPPGASPCKTVNAALADAEFAPPLLIATADHALLTPAMVRHFLDSIPADTDVAVAVARRETIAAAYPHTRRTYWRFADAHVSGCNLFFLNGEGAGRLVAFWGEMERDRKRPWKVAWRLGLGTLLRLALGRLTLEQALGRVGRRIGARIAAIDMPFAEAAMDVDRASDLALAESILAGRPPC